MKFNGLNSVLKESLQNMQKSSLTALLENDADYQTYIQASGKAARAYVDSDLTKKQREIVSELLECNTNVHSEYSVLSYLAGLVDGANIAALLNMRT